MQNGRMTSSLLYFIESSYIDKNEKLDRLSNRMQVCNEEIRRIDNSIKDINKKAARKFITHEDATEKIAKLSEKKARLQARIEKYKSAYKSLIWK